MSERHSEIVARLSSEHGLELTSAGSPALINAEEHELLPAAVISTPPTISDSSTLIPPSTATTTTSGTTGTSLDMPMDSRRNTVENPAAPPTTDTTIAEITLPAVATPLKASMNISLDDSLHKLPSPSVHMHPQEHKQQRADPDHLYDPLYGIGFSGGGIRSASFCSGVLWELLQQKRELLTVHDEEFIQLPRGVLPKYISCVSGGGYIGSSFLYWTRLKNGVDPRLWASEYFTHMRKSVGYYVDFSNPLTAARDLFLTGALFNALIILNLCSILPTIFVISHTLFASFGVYDSYFLGNATDHANVQDPSTWFESRIGWFVTGFLIFVCIPGIVSLFANAVAETAYSGLYAGEPREFDKNNKRVKWLKGMAVGIAQFQWSLTSMIMLVMFYQIFVAASQEDSLSGSGVFTALIFRLLLVVALIFHFPGLLGLAFMSQFVTWVLSHDHTFFVFWTDSDGVENTESFDDHYAKFVLASKILLPFIAALAIMRERLLFEFSRWRLQRTFYGPTAHLLSTKEKTPKEMLVWKPAPGSPGEYPTYIAQCTVNNWRLAPANQMALIENLARTREADFYFQHLPKGPARHEIMHFLAKSELALLGPPPHDANYLKTAVAKAKEIFAAHPTLSVKASAFEASKDAEVKEIYYQLQRVALADKQVSSANYDALALASDGPWERYESGLIEPLRFTPPTNVNIAVSTAMAMSAAAGSFVNGDFGTVGKFNEDTQVLLGGHMGRWVATRQASYWALVLPLSLILPALLIFLPAIISGSDEDPCYHYWQVASPTFQRGDLTTGCHWWLHDNAWVAGRKPANSDSRPIGIILSSFGGELLSMLFLLFWTMITPLFARYLPSIFPFIPFSRLLTMLAGHSWWGQEIPPMLYISDGGHTENLGLLPLLSRKLTTIVLVNGGQDPDCVDLRSALKQAHDKLGITFRPLPADRVRRKQEHITSDANLDLEADITYFCKDKFQRVLVFEAVYTNPSESLLIPRPARYTYDGSPQYATIFYLQPTRLHPDGLIGAKRGDDLAGAPTVENVPDSHKTLAGCCCSCCHRFQRLLPISGTFPFHSTVFQFFTPMMYDAYHVQGARAMRDALSVRLRLHTRLVRQSRLEMLWQRNQDYTSDPIRIPKGILPMHEASCREAEAAGLEQKAPNALS